MKKIAITLCAVALSCGILAGCSSTSSDSSASSEETTTSSSGIEVTETDVTMQSISQDDAQANLDNSDYVYLDLRKAADYEAGHIPGAINADLDAVVSNGDYAAGVDTMTAEAQSAIDDDKDIVLICYSGKKYAQAGTDILNAMGADMTKVFTLDGGMKAWIGETETA